MNFTKTLKPSNLLNSDQAYTGKVYVNTKLYQEYLAMNSKKEPIYVSLKSFIFTLAANPEFPDDSLGLGKLIRQLAKISLTDTFQLSLYIPPIDKETLLSQVKFEVDVLQCVTPNLEIDDKDIEKILHKNFHKFYMQESQVF